MTKYGAKKVYYEGIKFDSEMEFEYYLHLRKLQEEGEVINIETHPKFLLQDKFTKRGINFRKIEYNADFKITYANGDEVIVDIKGMETTEFKIKQKLFEKKYPYELKLVCIAPKKYGGGWIEVHELKRLRKEEKKRKKAQK